MFGQTKSLFPEKKAFLIFCFEIFRYSVFRFRLSSEIQTDAEHTVWFFVIRGSRYRENSEFG